MESCFIGTHTTSSISHECMHIYSFKMCVFPTYVIKIYLYLFLIHICLIISYILYFSFHIPSLSFFKLQCWYFNFLQFFYVAEVFVSWHMSYCSFCAFYIYIYVYATRLNINPTMLVLFICFRKFFVLPSPGFEPMLLRYRDTKSPA